MERRDKESRQSSLPSSLIPHLYSRPQQPGDTSTATPFRPTLPLPDPTREDVESEPKELPSMRSSLTLPPVISSFAAASLLDDPRHSPQYLNYESRSAPNEHNPDFPTSPLDIPGSNMARSLSSLYLPSHTSRERYVGPIPRDPLYQAPRPQRASHDINSSFILPTPQEIMHPQTSWREGEAGPSSLVHSAQRDDGRIRGRRGSSQPAQLRPEASNRDDESDGEGYHPRGAREREIEGYHSGIGHSVPCTS